MNSRVYCTTPQWSFDIQCFKYRTHFITARRELRLHLVLAVVGSCHSGALFILSSPLERSSRLHLPPPTVSELQVHSLPRPRSTAGAPGPNTNRGVIFIGQRRRRSYRKTVRKISGFCRIVPSPSCRESKVCPRTGLTQMSNASVKTLSGEKSRVHFFYR